MYYFNDNLLELLCHETAAFSGAQACAMYSQTLRLPPTDVYSFRGRLITPPNAPL